MPTEKRNVPVPNRPSNHATHAILFDSLDDCHAWVTAKRNQGAWVSSGFKTAPQHVAALLTGDDRLVERSTALMDMIEFASMTDDTARETVRTVTGALADVPAYLSGNPNNMRLRRRREEKAPLRIICDLTSSGGLSSHLLERRGVATLALLRKLVGVGHAVELYAGTGLSMTAGGAKFAMTRMETSPMDLARSCWAMADTAYARHVMYGVCDTFTGDTSGRWPYNRAKWIAASSFASDRAQCEKTQRETYAAMLDTTPENILVIPPLYGDHDSEQPAFATDAGAAKWVQDTFASITAEAANPQ